MVRLVRVLGVLCVLWGTLAAGQEIEEPPADAANAPAVEVSAAGDAITLNVENVEIHSLLRLLAETRQANIVAGPEVTGTVSINLYNVPFDQALSAILGVAGYAHYVLDGITYVTTIDKRAELPAEISDFQVESFRINYLEPEEALSTITEFLSTGGKAVLSPGKVVVVHDAPHQLEVIRNLVRELDVPPRQVLIAAQIVSVSRDDNLDIGVGWDTLPVALYGAEAIAAGFAANFEELPDGATGLFAGTLQKGFRVYLDALQQRARVKVLAAPQVLVLDGQNARLQVGDRLGFRITTTTETASLESVEFLEVGTVLEVTPRIADDGLVQLEINPKVSTGTISSLGLPIEGTTEISTNMLVHDGGTIVIGGLLNASRQQRASQIPFVGDIPVLGKLFGRNAWIDDKTEVVVLITPYVVGATPSPAMLEKIRGAEREWGEMATDGLINDEPPPPVEKPRRAPLPGPIRNHRKGK